MNIYKGSEKNKTRAGQTGSSFKVETKSLFRPSATVSMNSIKGNSLAIERMREKDELDRLAKQNTGQRRGTPRRDISLQQKVFTWIMELLDERPKGKTDYDHWLQDGVILVKVMQCVMFNSVPTDMVIPKMQKLDTTQDRLKILKKYLRRFGVPEEYIFEDTDLVEFKNIPRVTRCVAMLAKMANVSTFTDLDLDIPPENDIYLGESDEDEERFG